MFLFKTHLHSRYMIFFYQIKGKVFAFKAAYQLTNML